MPYQYACFISYKRPPPRRATPGLLPRAHAQHFWDEFAEAFQIQLEAFLAIGMPVFRDVDLNPGTAYPEALSQNLCHSMCLIALVVPQYFESTWCVAEWNAMKTFEARRVPQGSQKLIIPVVFGGDKTVLDPRFGGRTSFDLRGLSSPARQLRNARQRDKIRIIAETINNLSSHLVPLEACDCQDYSLGLGPDVSSPLIPEPSPLGR